MLASSQAAASTAATHSRSLNAYTTMTATGARTKTASDTWRSTPRRDRKKYAAARLTAAPASPTASIVRLFSPAKTTTTATAAARSRKLRRASQRWADVGSSIAWSIRPIVRHRRSWRFTRSGGIPGHGGGGQTPAACMPRSSCLRSRISSRRRAATSNCSSAAAACICSVSSVISPTSSPRAALLGVLGSPASACSAARTAARARDDRPGTGALPRDCCRPPPPISCSVSASSRTIWSRMSAMRLRSGWGSMPCFRCIPSACRGAGWSPRWRAAWTGSRCRRT